MYLSSPSVLCVWQSFAGRPTLLLSLAYIERLLASVSLLTTPCVCHGSTLPVEVPCGVSRWFAAPGLNRFVLWLLVSTPSRKGCLIYHLLTCLLSPCTPFIWRAPVSEIQTLKKSCPYLSCFSLWVLHTAGLARSSLPNEVRSLARQGSAL